MNGPVAHVGSSKPLASLSHDVMQSGGWPELQKLMHPAQTPNPFRPDDKMLRELARYSQTVEGAAVVAWLRSITDLAPYPNMSGGNIQQVAIAAAKHDGRAIIGRSIAAAIAEGITLQNQSKGK